MKKVLVVIDMQNDFVTGSLANKDAEKIIPGIVQTIKDFDGDIYATKDTHDNNYLSTAEGKALPVSHCISGTKGWEIVKDIYVAMRRKEGSKCKILNKSTFGLVKYGWDDYDEYVLVGTCTDICVISNALIIKAKHPESKVSVIASLCAGVTPEKHQAALDVMRSCQIEVIE